MSNNYPQLSHSNRSNLRLKRQQPNQVCKRCRCNRSKNLKVLWNLFWYLARVVFRLTTLHLRTSTSSTLTLPRITAVARVLVKVWVCLSPQNKNTLKRSTSTLTRPRTSSTIKTKIPSLITILFHRYSYRALLLTTHNNITSLNRTVVLVRKLSKSKNRQSNK